MHNYIQINNNTRNEDHTMSIVTYDNFEMCENFVQKIVNLSIDVTSFSIILYCSNSEIDLNNAILNKHLRSTVLLKNLKKSFISHLII